MQILVLSLRYVLMVSCICDPPEPFIQVAMAILTVHPQVITYKLIYNLFYVIFVSTFFKKLGVLFTPKLLNDTYFEYLIVGFGGDNMLPQFLFDQLPISNFFIAKYLKYI